MATERQRIDRWLFFARVVKSRTRAAKLVQGGKLRINGDKISQASFEIKPGDVLTINLERRVAIHRVIDCGTRRGPAVEAKTLYEDLSPPPLPKADSALDLAPGIRPAGTGRPTKKERRALDRLAGDEPGSD